jgi:hypothetical protein
LLGGLVLPSDIVALLPEFCNQERNNLAIERASAGLLSSEQIEIWGRGVDQCTILKWIDEKS